MTTKKTKRTSLLNSVSFPLVICLLTLIFFQGCTTTSSSVIAATGTTIGLELSQNQTTQTPTAVLGYKRAELAYVPTNRGNAGKTTTSQDLNNKPVNTSEDGLPPYGAGARDSANVLMELRYSGIFDWKGSGIYQRLAVGDKAVKQPGATLLFSKNNEGNPDAEAVKYAALARTAISTEKERIDKIVSYVTDGSDTVNNQTLKTILGQAKSAYPKKITMSVENAILEAGKTGSELRKKLFDPLDQAIEPLYLSLPKEKQ